MTAQGNDFSKIMLVEDDPLVSIDLTDRLERLGFFNITTFQRGEEAIRCFREEQPEVVIMDIELEGELDGIATAERLKQMADVPIIFLTANVNKEVMQRISRIDIVRFLPKPFIDVQVAENIEMALRQRHKPKAVESDGLLEEESVFVFDNEGKHKKILCSEIRYLEADGSYCDIYIAQKGKLKVTGNMKLVFEKVQKTTHVGKFVRISKSHVVNTRHITGLYGARLVLGEDKLMVSKHYIPDLKERFNII